VAVKKKNAKAGSVPPLRKKYIYYLLFGVAVLGAMRGKDLLRMVQKQVGRSSASARVMTSDGGSASARVRSAGGQVLARAVKQLSTTSLAASNQLTVVRYIIIVTQDNRLDPDQELAWIPKVVALYRDGAQAWRFRTADDQFCLEDSVVKASRYNGLRVVYLDERSVLLCPETEHEKPYPKFALPVSCIDENNGQRVLKVEGKRVGPGDHILFAGWNFDILMIARDRFAMAVKPMGAEEGRVRLYQFVL